MRVVFRASTLKMGGAERVTGEVSEGLKGLLIYASFILGVGYSYVLLVLGTVFVLKRLGVVAPSRAI